MNNENEVCSKTPESSASNVLPKKDSKLMNFVNTLRYFIYALTGLTGYRSILLANKKVGIRVPAFFHYSKMETDAGESEEFSYRQMLAMTFTEIRSDKNFDAFIQQKKESVDSKNWNYNTNLKFELRNKYNFSQLIFEDRNINFYKGMFICGLNGGYFVITIIAPIVHFLNPKSFIYKLFSTLLLVQR